MPGNRDCHSILLLKSASSVTARPTIQYSQCPTEAPNERDATPGVPFYNSEEEKKGGL